MQKQLFHCETPHYINGAWVDGHKDLFSSHSPIDNHIVWTGHAAGENDVALAFEAAKTALAAWFKIGFEKRKETILKFANIIAKKRHELTNMIAEETGKPLWDAATETNAVLNKIPLSIEAYQARTPEIKMVSSDHTAFIHYKPHGVVAVLGPFNFPAHLSNGHIVPALLAGNTVIYKPSELTPKVAKFIMECWHESGLPKGVINCIQGDKHTATILLQQEIQAVYFTGSYQTGLEIHRSFAEKPHVLLALEMGGNNPLIIDELKDEHIPAAVYHSIVSSYITSGQRCTCARRILVKDNFQGESFLARFIEATKQLRVGAYTVNPEPFMGPVIRHSHAKQHLIAQQTLCHQGGVPLLPMSSLSQDSGLLSPGIIDMRHATEFYDEEIFAPLVQIEWYHDFDEAIYLANQTKYGLVTGLISQNEHHFKRCLETLRTGVFHWNKSTTQALSSLPFGGIGKSGNHRPSAFFASDYCAYPLSINTSDDLSLPSSRLPGIL